LVRESNEVGPIEAEVRYYFNSKVSSIHLIYSDDPRGFHILGVPGFTFARTFGLVFCSLKLQARRGVIMYKIIVTGEVRYGMSSTYQPFKKIYRIPKNPNRECAEKMARNYAISDITQAAMQKCMFKNIKLEVQDV
jgi:hypothetical protein